MNSLANLRKVWCGPWSALAVALVLPTIGLAQSSCPIIPADEAAAILGGKPTRTEEAFKCTYALAGGRATLIVALQTMGSHSLGQMVFTDSRKEFVGKGATVKDEPSIGQPAFSFAYPIKEGERDSGFFVWKGSGVLMVWLIEKGAGPMTRSAGGIDKLRPIIKKAAGRI